MPGLTTHPQCVGHPFAIQRVSQVADCTSIYRNKRFYLPFHWYSGSMTALTEPGIDLRTIALPAAHLHRDPPAGAHAATGCADGFYHMYTINAAH